MCCAHRVYKLLNLYLSEPVLRAIRYINCNRLEVFRQTVQLLKVNNSKKKLDKAQFACKRSCSSKL